MDSVINYIPANIEKYRIASGLTEQELSDQARVTINTLHDETTTICELDKISKVLKVKISLFFNNPGLSEFSTMEIINELACRDGVRSTGFRSIAWGGQL